MGSVIDVKTCPKCGRETLATDYYYRSGEEYAFCKCCGYGYSYTKKEEPVRVHTKIADLILQRETLDYTESLWDPKTTATYEAVSPEQARKWLEKGLSRLDEFATRSIGENMSMRCWLVYKREDGEYKAVSPNYELDGDDVISLYADYEHKENGGFGVASIKQGIAHGLYRLKEDISKEELKVYLDAVEKADEGYVALFKNGKFEVLAGEEEFEQQALEEAV